MVKQELLEALANPDKFLEMQKDLRCNADAIKTLEAAITEDTRYESTAMSYDKELPFHYVCMAVEEDGALILCFNEDGTKAGFKLSNGFREFTPNSDVQTYCKAIKGVVDREIFNLHSNFVNMFIKNLHYGTRAQIADEFLTFFADALVRINEGRNTGIECQYDLDELALVDENTIETVLNKYGTVESNVHFI